MRTRARQPARRMRPGAPARRGPVPTGLARVLAAGAGTARRPPGISADALLELQRTAGNAATMQLLGVQRCEEGSCDCAEEASAPGGGLAAGDQVQRQTGGGRPAGAGEAGQAGETRGVGGGAVTGGVSCRSGNCPEEFCTPLPRLDAEVGRFDTSWVVGAAIAVAVSPRVVPLWADYMWGGSPPRDLSSDFGPDFTADPATATATDFLVTALLADLTANPPTFPPGSDEVSITIEDRIRPQIDELGSASSPHRLRFTGGIPGNIAGGVDKLQTSCRAGAQPSPFNDDRSAAGTATVTRNPDGSLTVTPSIRFTVQDTIDFCPGNCGSGFLTQRFTVLLSRWEATGISGDVPFTVRFPAPARTPSIIPAPTPPSPVPPTPPPGPGPCPSTGSKPLLKRSSTGPEVTEVACKLNRAAAPLLPLREDSRYGPRTRSGVVAFQATRGLTVDGKVGPLTWTALESETGPSATRPTLVEGNTGPAVEDLQARLNAIGEEVTPVAEGTVFDAEVEAAVVGLQDHRGLGVDGKVGASTWASLDDAPAGP